MLPFVAEFPSASNFHEDMLVSYDSCSCDEGLGGLGDFFNFFLNFFQSWKGWRRNAVITRTNVMAFEAFLPENSFRIIIQGID